MTERLSARDVSFLYLETATTAMHVGGVARFAPPAGEPFDYEALCALVSRRITQVPRYRQAVRWVPAHLANPVWVDDEDFDITYHVRRSALPRPGSDDQLKELVGRLQARHLDRRRPLWEVYLVEGLADDRFAIVTKTHLALAERSGVPDIAELILDPEPTPRATPDDTWVPRPVPSRLGLLSHALIDTVRRPTEAVETVRSATTDVRTTLSRGFGAAAEVAALAGRSLRPAPASPLNAEIGAQRRFAMAATSLDDYKRVRKTHGGSVNDVILAVVAGALRIWLLSRGEAVVPATTVRALLPVSVRGDDDDASGPAAGARSRVSPYFVDLPVGEPSPVVRLHQVSYAMQAHKESGRAVGADGLVRLTGFAPPTIHAAAARLGSGLSRRMFNVIVTNVPGPQYSMYAAGARMLDCYPVIPLASGQAVTIGLTSYDGNVYFGLNADRDSLPDADVLAGCLQDALAELVGTLR